MSDKKYKVLIVDDDKFLLDVYSVKFKQAGHKVSTSLSGDEVLEKLREQDDFDAIMLDIVMPQMDGFELLENIRKEGLAKNTSLIVLTNQGDGKDIEKAKSFDIDGYIVKASTIPSDVLKEVLSIIEKKKS